MHILKITVANKITYKQLTARKCNETLSTTNKYSNAESREYMLTYFLGNGSIFSFGGWEHEFIGGMGRNLWGDEYPHPPWICTPVSLPKILRFILKHVVSHSPILSTTSLKFIFPHLWFINLFPVDFRFSIIFNESIVVQLGITETKHPFGLQMKLTIAIIFRFVS